MSTAAADTASNTEWQRQGATLRALRLKTGLKVGEMANALVISSGYLSNIEAGRKPLTPVLLAKAADILDVPQIAIAKPHLIDAAA